MPVGALVRLVLGAIRHSGEVCWYSSMGAKCVTHLVSVRVEF